MSASRAVWAPRLMRGSFGVWICALVALPMIAVIARAAEGGLGGAWEAITRPAAAHALGLSFGLSLLVVGIDLVFGLATAWALVRWEIPGRRLVNALVDLPFAVPTLVAGILLVVMLGPQSTLGGALADVGVDVIYAWPGMVLALCFVTLPFVVRAVEPVLEELDPAEEEAARTLGASEALIVRQVLLPPLFPALAVGAGQSFARAIGEFGAMAVLSGNVPRETLVGSVYVLGEVEAGDSVEAAAVSVVLLVVSILAQLVVSRVNQPWGRS